MFALSLFLTFAVGAHGIFERTWTTYVTMRDGIKLHTRISVPR
jgi:predicted acyl esterase